MAKKEISKFLVAAIKRTAMNCSQLTTKKAKLVKKMAEMQEELDSIQVQLDSFQAPIKEATGGYTTEDLVKRVIEDTGKVDKDGKPIKQTKYVLLYPDTIIPPTEESDDSAESSVNTPAEGTEYSEAEVAEGTETTQGEDGSCPSGEC